MTQGGARNRSGPAYDPMSLRSGERGLARVALPAAGYAGDVPAFPLMAFVVYRWETEDKRRFQVRDDEATDAFRERETELWAQAWSYPQATAWSREPWRWNAVAMWVRTQVVCESSEATAADKGAIHRFADQIGMTPAGLKENGWEISVEAETDEGEAGQPDPVAEPAASARDRMTVITGGVGA